MTDNQIICNANIKHFKVNLGDIYISNSYVIAEFDDGVDVCFENFNEVTLLVKDAFNNNPFGFIANRKNCYSTNPVDASKFNLTFPNLRAYAIVAHNNLTESICIYQNHFCDKNKMVFNKVNDAIEWVDSMLN